MFGQPSNPAFNQGTNLLFGQSTTPVFNQGGTNPLFGKSTTPAFNQGPNHLFGKSTTPVFNQGTNPLFGQSTTPAFNQGTNPLFAQVSQGTNSNLSNTIGNTPNPFVFNPKTTNAFNLSFGQFPDQKIGSSSAQQSINANPQNTGTTQYAPVQASSTNEFLGVKIPQSISGMPDSQQRMTPVNISQTNLCSGANMNTANTVNPYLNILNTSRASVAGSGNIPSQGISPYYPELTNSYTQGSTAPSTPTSCFTSIYGQAAQQQTNYEANRMIPTLPTKPEKDFAEAFKDPHGLSWLYSESVSTPTVGPSFYKKYISPSVKAKKNHVVAAKLNKYEGTTDFKFSEFINKKTINAPKTNQKKILEMNNIESSHIAVDSENRPSKERVPEEMLPVLTKEGYYTIPSIDQLREMNESQITAVPDFTVGNEHGKVVFIGKTNVSQLNLDKIISINQKVLLLYPDGCGISKPEEGKGLNKEARVHLYNCTLLNGKTIQESQVRRLCQKIHVQFVSWNPDTKEWTFDINKI